ncbi:MAG: ABC transporter ATP-binding protein [Bacillus sp. (in: firmicutes)]
MRKVELERITKSYDKGRNVISNISVTIEPGEFFVLVGPSGCGKSTILRMIAGLEDISGGIIRIGDEVANGLPPDKRGISMVFQNYALYPHLSVEENIVFGLHIKKIAKEERRRRCLEVAEMLGLIDYLKQKPRELSGGQRQRVALARAIVSESPICLMDEPLSNLDAKLRAHMRSEIRRLQRRFGITMIYVTHDQIEAMTMGDRIMILHDGKIQQIGKPIDLYNHPSNPFVATFIGSPPMNVANGQMNEKQDRIEINNAFSFVMGGFSELSPGEAVIIGIRPEHLQPIRAASHASCRISAVVHNVEVLGDETVISFMAGDQEWFAKWTGQWAIDIGDSVVMEIDDDMICLFDKETGQMLKSPRNIARQAPGTEFII